jgi:two-component system C4-dicarboxylate transport sensor histidine kinase DctB
LLEDTGFNLDLLLKERKGNSVAGRQQMNDLILLSTIRNQINLISNIVTRTTDIDDSGILENNRVYVYQLLTTLRQDSARLSGSASMLSAIQTIDEFTQLISAEQNLFSLNAARLELLNDSLDLISSNRRLLEEFNRQIEFHAMAQQKSVVTDTLLAERKIAQSQFFMLIILIICLVIALLTGWLYVDRSLVYRIMRLHGNMQAIADGRMETDIVTSGNDEISSMARSLETFRDTLVVTQQELVQAGKLAALGQLSAGVAHELNQPLAAIRNFTHNTQILLDRNKIDTVQENLEEIAQLTEKMAGIITQFKDFSRKSSQTIAPLNLAEVLDNALALLENRIQQNSVDLRVLPFDRNLQVEAETIRLEQVFVNLLGNAVDAVSVTKDKTIEVQVDSSQDTGMVSISVRDRGVGVDHAAAEQVFEPFYTTKDPGEGLGLGLSISYNIVRDFAGKLYLNSVAPQGAEFVIELKRATCVLS